MELGSKVRLTQFPPGWPKLGVPLRIGDIGKIVALNPRNPTNGIRDTIATVTFDIANVHVMLGREHFECVSRPKP